MNNPGKPAAPIRHLLDTDSLSADELVALLDRAEFHRGVSTATNAPSASPVTASLAGRTAALLFFENSTRTVNSFHIAAERLGIGVRAFSDEGSSTAKGESLIDTARTLESMGLDWVVVRHPAAGAAHQLSRQLRCSVINAGDGAHAHPTQGLLDALTIRNKLGRIAGLTVVIVGDIAHSRVARSALSVLRKLGARVILVGPPGLLQRSFASLGAEIRHELDPVLAGADVVMSLRIQNERLRGPALPSLAEFVDRYQMNADRLAHCKSDVLLMHPGPMNRGIEMTGELADGAASAVRDQVTNGVFVRMAVFEWTGQSAGHS